MRTDATRTLFAIGTLLCTTSMAAANDVGYSNLERSLPGRPQGQSEVPGVRQVDYLSEVDAYQELPSDAAAMPQQAHEMYHHGHQPMEWCTDGGCGGCPHCCQPDGGYQPDASYQPKKGMFYSEAQLMFLRAHVLEESLGKLSEKYEFTPRFILGYESPSGWGARARYWTYGRTTQILNDDDSLRLDFDVIDVEGTTRFSTDRADLLLACGFRWVNADIEVDDESVSASMPGLTVAADVRTRICGGCRSQWSGIAGARWSILGCDWEGDDDALIEPTSDDNVLVQELYGGVEYVCHYRKCDLYARLVFEVQNWHSDALAQSGGTDSIGFVGPGVHAGATY